MATSSGESDFRILLVGKTGHGKSSTANSILGEQKFEVSVSAKSVTKTTAWSGIVNRYGKSVEVVDTPGIFYTYRPAHKIHKELIRSLVFTTPGFHAIAFVLEKGRFTEEVEKTKDLFFEWFGPRVKKYACIILTRTDDKETMDTYLSEDATEGLVDLITRCGGKERVACINNKADSVTKEHQVKGILEMIEKIKKSNNNTNFSNVAFELATSYAYNKCSDRITPDSIHVLQKAGVQMQLSDKKCKILDKLFEIDSVSMDIECGLDSVGQIRKQRTRSQRKFDLNTVRFTPMINLQGSPHETRNYNTFEKTSARVKLTRKRESSIKDEEGMNESLYKPGTSKQSNKVDKTKQTSQYVNIKENNLFPGQSTVESRPLELDFGKTSSPGTEKPENRYGDVGTAERDTVHTICILNLFSIL